MVYGVGWKYPCQPIIIVKVGNTRRVGARDICIYFQILGEIVEQAIIDPGIYICAIEEYPATVNDQQEPGPE
jgi:hypothetical protein